MSVAKWRYASAVVAAMILLIHPALADQCDDLREDEPRIVACTQSINSGKWKGRNQAINYLNRGWAYSGKGDYDRAIADYNQAMGLHPNYALAYNNRGLAYYHKVTTTAPSSITARPSASTRSPNRRLASTSIKIAAMHIA